MNNKLKPIQKIHAIADQTVDRSALAKRVKQAMDSGTLTGSRSAPVSPAHRREVPATYLKLEPKPVSAYDDNPVLNEIGAARIVGVSADCLKKWKQRNQGPDYIQYGHNGAVRYELKALM